jgi:release factor glutamine methyltransferase
MTYRECYEQGCRTLQAAGIEEAALDARLLLEAVCGTDRNDLLVHGEQPVAPEAEEKYLNWIRQRAEHIPLQQLTGEQDFMGLTFNVNEHVLIPRQDTEILVEEVLKELHDGMRILDMCTGSGCILLSLLHYSNALFNKLAHNTQNSLSSNFNPDGRIGVSTTKRILRCSAFSFAS